MLINSIEGNEMLSLTGLMAKLFVLRGVHDLARVPGLTEIAVDGFWKVKINPHMETIDDLGPGEFAVYYNGWPAWILGLDGSGVMASGDAANPDTFRRALIDALAKVKLC